MRLFGRISLWLRTCSERQFLMALLMFWFLFMVPYMFLCAKVVIYLDQKY